MTEIRKILTTTVLILALITISQATAAALSCGNDICVNETGWWRDSGAFNASGTPIQAAVDNAGSGDVICVAAGSYTESVDIATPHLTLAGEGAGVVTVTANQSSDHVFNVTADYVNISGFNATGATGSGKAGIRLSSADHCNISENNCSNNRFGIWLYDSSNSTLTGNTANSNDRDGIYLCSSSNYNTLTGNTANSNHYGIRLDDSSNNTLTNNTADSNCGDDDDYGGDGYGICLSSSSNNALTNNTADSNCGGDGDECGGYGYGIRLSSSSNNALTNNTADSNCGGDGDGGGGGYGIWLYDSSNNTLTNNTASSNCGGYGSWGGGDGYGIRLYSSSDNNVSCNWVHNNTDAGFYLEGGSTGNTIERNNIISNGVYNDTSDGYEWQFYNGQPDDVNTDGNWWGTNNKTRINAEHLRLD